MPADSMMRTFLNRINGVLEGISSSADKLDEARQRLSPEDVKAREQAANEKRKQQMRDKAAQAKQGGVPEGLRQAVRATGRKAQKAADEKRGEQPIKGAMSRDELLQKQAARKEKEKGQRQGRAQQAIQQRWAGAEGNIRAAAHKEPQVIPARPGAPDRGKHVQLVRGGGPQSRPDQVDPAKHSHLVKAARLMNIQLNRRAQEKAYHAPGAQHHEPVDRPQDQEPRDHSGKRVAKYHHDKASGQVVHSSGRKDTKKFANNTTFRSTPDDAMLHTDKSTKGTRATAGTDEFAFHGDTDKDPRQKWYRVSAQGGYASAMASLGKIYHKDPKMRAKVIQKVKSIQFPGAKGHSIRVDPTGALHNERTACMRDKKGNLHPAGEKLRASNPEKFNRLCKGAHGPSGTPDRNEYKAGFDPKHSDPTKLHALHHAAQRGKAEQPSGNIAQHMAARPLRRKFVKKAVRHMIRQGVKSGRAFAAGE